MKVAMGLINNETDGIGQHILGIQKYSSHTVRTIPSRLERRVLWKSPRRREYYQMVRSRIKLNRFDIIHSHVAEWYTGLCQMSRTNKCKWVHSYHMYYFESDWPGGFQGWQESINDSLINVASNADLRISVSQWLHDFLLDRFSIETVVIPNGFDFEKCSVARPERFSERYDLEDFVLFVGTFSPRKNTELFVRLAQRIPDKRFVMIGRPFGKKSIAETYGESIPPNLTIIGELKHEDVLDAMSACRVFVMTSRREGLPTVLMEAMAMAKPVVASNVYGCNEVVQHEENGFLFELNSIEDLVEKTKRAFDSTQIGQKAREKVAATYSWNVIAKKIDAVYESLE